MAAEREPACCNNGADCTPTRCDCRCAACSEAFAVGFAPQLEKFIRDNAPVGPVLVVAKEG